MPERHVINPNPGGQADFMRSAARYPAMIGGLFSGKTWAGSAKLVQAHVFYTGTDSLAIAPTFTNLRQITIPALVERLDDAGIPHVVNLGDMEIRTSDLNSKILLHSGLNAERITGFTVGRTWIDEPGRIPNFKEPHRNVWKNAVGRTRDPRVPVGGHQVMCTGTHEGKGTWLYQDWELKPKRSHVLFRASTYENPIAFDYANTLVEEYGAELAEQYVKGGAVESSMAAIDWDVLVRAQDERASSHDTIDGLAGVRWPLYAGMDIGRSQSLTVIWIVSDRGGVLITEAVLVRKGLEFSKQSELIGQVMGLPGFRVLAIDATYNPQTAEDALKAWGDTRVKPVVFSVEKKLEVYSRWIKYVQDRTIRIPESQDILMDFYSVKRIVSARGVVQYHAPFTADGHSDRASACGLAVEAAQHVVQEFNFVGGDRLRGVGLRRS